MSDLAQNSLTIGQRPALLLVDLSVGFTDSASPLGCECSGVLKANADLLAAFRLHKLPVFFTTVVYHNDSDASVFRKKIPALNILTTHSPWVAIDPRVKPRESELVVEKCWASAFFGTDLKQHLIEAGVDSLVVTGLTTSGCVRATAVDGLQHNYSVTVVEEAVGDRNKKAHEANLFDMQAKYNQVASLSELLGALAERDEKL